MSIIRQLVAFYLAHRLYRAWKLAILEGRLDEYYRERDRFHRWKLYCERED